MYIVLLALLILFITVHCKEEDDDENIDNAGPTPGEPCNVTYDGRSILINDKRKLIFSGSVHYPRLPVAV